MAEARAEEDEERLREPGGARRSAEHSDRNKPDQRNPSQGPLSSIRAVIKRSTRTSSQSDHQRDRRRPEITILSAEPLPTNTWFPGASGAFPPAPPPAPPTWSAGSATVQLPPPSYEQVIREKSREQNSQSSSPSPSPSSSSSSASARLSTSTIATQTDTPSSAARPARRPPKPPRPSPPAKNTDLDRTNLSSGQSVEPQETLREQCGVQTDFDDVIDDVTPIDPAPIDPTSTSSPTDLDSPSELMKADPGSRPRPRPRSRILQPENIKQPMTREVKVQTLVRLKDDGAENIFAGFDDTPSNISSKYLEDLLEVFSPDDTRIQQENQQSQMSDGEVEEVTASCSTKTPVEPQNRPQPRPRTQKSKPQLTPKPSVFEVFETRDPEVEQNSSKPLSPPVPAPRPLLNKLQSPAEPALYTPPEVAAAASGSSERRNSDDLMLMNQLQSPTESRFSPSGRSESTPSGQQVTAVASCSSERRNSDDLMLLNKSSPSQSGRSSPSDRPQNTRAASSSSSERRNSDGQMVKTSPVMLTDRNGKKRPTVPKHSRPPPPVLRKTASTSQVSVDVSRTDEASVPPLPPRPSGGRLLPLRPPPIKVTKPAGPSSSPAVTNQLPGNRVQKRGPPLPPRPKPGHPLYKRYSSKDLEDLEVENPSKEQEEPSKETSLHEEQLLIVLDDKGVPETLSNTLHELQTSEVKGQDGVLTSEKHNQQNTQNRFVVARFAFEGEEAELSFSEGDVITVIEYVNEEWGRGSLNGRTGIFPLSFIQASEETEASPRKPLLESPAPPAGVRSRGRALYDFTPECEDELCLKAGDIVCDLEDMDADWFQGEFGGKRGIVPKNFIQVLLEP